MRSEHGNSLHFISSAVHFLYKSFPKKSIFSTTTSQKVDFLYINIPPKSHFSGKNFKKIAPQNPGSPPPGGRAPVPTRRPSPTLLYQSLRWTHNRLRWSQSTCVIPPWSRRATRASGDFGTTSADYGSTSGDFVLASGDFIVLGRLCRPKTNPKP